jgi:hypothetical protein
MSVSTILLHFCSENGFENEVFIKSSVEIIQKELGNHFNDLKVVFSKLFGNERVWILMDDSGVIFTVRFFKAEGIITLNIEYIKKHEEKERFSFMVS